MTMKIKLSHTEVEVNLFLEVLGVYGILVLALVGIYYLEPAITGFVTVTKELNYSDDVNLEFSESAEYTWNLANPGNLKSVKVSGKMDDQGEARVYIENNGVRHLIFDSTQLVEKESGMFGITGFAVSEDEESGEEEEGEEVPINGTEIINQTTINETPIINETIINETFEKIININLEYSDNEFYDANNDGVEKFDGITDFSVSGSSFNWDTDESKLCTRYEIFSVENQESGFACFGNDNCCNFVDLESSRNLWNESLFLSYGSYGSTNNNIIFSQILYVDYNLSLESPYTDIVYSSWDNKTAKFVEGLIEFEDICIDSCVFSGNASSYNLIIEVENTTLNIDLKKYLVEQKATNSDPIAVKQIANISILKNEDYTLDLNEYFSDEDNDELNYGYYEIDNITIRFENDLAYIVPDKDFVGSRFTFITANDSYGNVNSNVFKIEAKSGELSIEFLDSNVEDRNWTVSFSTKGVGDLTISAVNGTYLEMYNDNISTVNDLDILELTCGDFEIFDKDSLIENEELWFVLVNGTTVKLIDLIQVSDLIKSVYVEDYNCEETGYYTIKMSSGDVKTLEFIFGDEIKIINSDYGVMVESLEIRDKEDNKLAVFDSFGNVEIKGNLTQNISVDENDFIIEDMDDRLNLIVTNPEGNLQIKGSLNENRSELSPGSNSFVIKNKEVGIVAYVNSSGSLFLTGTLTESVSFE
ncbi:MAG: hypothetical protein QF798_02810 [Candidatus Woesearchaeota archaeon]|nr:hypothetical protein [Candidatus Woesearchaeota archaeon]